MTSVDRIQGLSGQQAIKTPCRLATTANITLSGEQTIDGVAAVEGDRVLVKDQTTTTQNGVYDVSTGSWTRSLDFDGPNDITDGTMVLVNSGSTYADKVFKLNATEPITIDTTALTFTVATDFTDISAFAATLLDDANAAAMRTTLGARGEADDVTLAAGKSVVFEGTTDDTFEGTLSGGDPTADRTWTFPDKSGTVAMTSDIPATSATRTTFTASGNLTIPAGVTQVIVTGQAAGGGGGGSTDGGDGGDLTFGPNGGAVVLTLGGGKKGTARSGSTPGAGGPGGGSGLTQGESGRSGQSLSNAGGVVPDNICDALGGQGGSGMFGELGGGGHGGAGTNRTAAGGGGGGAGEQCFRYPITVTPSTQYDVTIGSVGSAGTGASAGKGGFFVVEYVG